MTIVGNPDAVVGGVDTHADVHVAAVVNHLGGVLGGQLIWASGARMFRERGPFRLLLETIPRTT